MQLLKKIFSNWFLIGVLCFFLWMPILNLYSTLMYDTEESILKIIIAILFIAWALIFLLKKKWKISLILLVAFLLTVSKHDYDNILEFIENKNFIVNFLVIAITFIPLLLRFHKFDKPIRILILGTMSCMVLLAISKIIYPITLDYFEDLFIYTSEPDGLFIYSNLLITFLIRSLIIIISLSPLLITLLIVSNTVDSYRLFAPLFYAFCALFVWELIPITYGYNLATSIVAFVVYGCISYWIGLGLRNLSYCSDLETDNTQTLMIKGINSPISRRIILSVSCSGIFFMAVAYLFLLIAINYG
mgnify:FL=1